MKQKLGGKQTLKLHLDELRRRLFFSVGFLLLTTMLAYVFSEQLIGLIQKPLNDTLYYTSPGGSFYFTFKISMLFGVIAGTPVWFYNLIRFLEPALAGNHKVKKWRLLLSSHLLFVLGMAFGYFITLPAALKFLTGFGGESLEALIGVDEYLNFVIVYLVGFGLLFLLPLAILTINRLKPLKPSKMTKHLGWVVLVSFVLSAIITPTPDPFNQVLMAGPIIIMYILSIVLVVVRNQRPNSNFYLPKVVVPAEFSTDSFVELLASGLKIEPVIIDSEPERVTVNIIQSRYRLITDIISS